MPETYVKNMNKMYIFLLFSPVDNNLIKRQRDR